MSYVYNPKELPEADLPIIYGYADTELPKPNDIFTEIVGYTLSQDGRYFAQSTSSDEYYLKQDLGVVQGGKSSLQKYFQHVYPDGYRCEYIPLEEAKQHDGLQQALNKARERMSATTERDDRSDDVTG